MKHPARVAVAALVLLAAALGGGWPALRAQAASVPVLLLSIDGLKPDYVLAADRHGLKIPHLRQLVHDGAHASGVTGVTPTVTYPSHTTLVTGVSPAAHGIVTNTPFDPLGHNGGGWYWYAEDIKAPTLWGVAGQAGLVTANVDWPVTVGAPIQHNIAQYWHGESSQDRKLLRVLSTPGLLDEAERANGPYPAGYRYHLPDDQDRARFVVWMIGQKRPGFMTAYLSSLDEEQHETAPYSPETFATLEGLDASIGQIRAAMAATYGPRHVLAVVSDHGHIHATREVHLNAALREAGLIDVDAQGKITAWLAVAWNSGGSAGIVLQRSDDADLRDRVRSLLRRAAGDPAAGIDRVVEGAAAEALQGYRGTAFVVGLAPGFKTGAALAGPMVTTAAAPGGTHGYLPGHRDMESAFFVAGEGIPAGLRLGTIDMRDIAPTLAARLGVTLPAAEGRNRIP
jgi:predicted AlkP superfamily pyrophosphatase or phosphodiesterase